MKNEDKNITVKPEGLLVRIWLAVKYNLILRWWYSGRRRATGTVRRRNPELVRALQAGTLDSTLVWVSSKPRRLFVLCGVLAAATSLAALLFNGYWALPDSWPEPAETLTLLLAYVGLTVSVLVFAVPHRQRQVVEYGREDSRLALREGWLVMMSVGLTGVLLILSSAFLHPDAAATLQAIWLIALAPLLLGLLLSTQRFVLDMGPSRLRKVLVEADLSETAGQLELQLLNAEFLSLVQAKAPTLGVDIVDYIDPRKAGSLGLERQEVVQDMDLRLFPELQRCLLDRTDEPSRQAASLGLLRHPIGWCSSFSATLAIRGGPPESRALRRVHSLRRVGAINVQRPANLLRKGPLEMRLDVLAHDLREGRSGPSSENLGMLRDFAHRALELTQILREREPAIKDLLGDPLNCFAARRALMVVAYEAARAAEPTHDEVVSRLDSICDEAIRCKEVTVFSEFCDTIVLVYYYDNAMNQNRGIRTARFLRDYLSDWLSGMDTAADSTLTAESGPTPERRMRRILQKRMLTAQRYSVENRDFQSTWMWMEHLWELNGQAERRAELRPHRQLARRDPAAGEGDDQRVRLVEMIAVSMGWALHLAPPSVPTPGERVQMHDAHWLFEQYMNLGATVPEYLHCACSLRGQFPSQRNDEAAWDFPDWDPPGSWPTGRTDSRPDATWAVEGALVMAIAKMGATQKIGGSKLDLASHEFEQMESLLTELREDDFLREFLQVSGEEWQRRVGLVLDRLRRDAEEKAKKWHSAVVAAEISEKRKGELTIALNKCYRMGFHATKIFNAMEIETEDNGWQITDKFAFKVDKTRLIEVPGCEPGWRLDPRELPPGAREHERMGRVLADAAHAAAEVPPTSERVVAAIQGTVRQVFAQGGTPIILLFGTEPVVGWLVSAGGYTPESEPEGEPLRIGRFENAPVLLWSMEREPYVLVGSKTSVSLRYGDPIWSIESVKVLPSEAGTDPLRPKPPMCTVLFRSSMRVCLDASMPLVKIPLDPSQLGFGVSLTTGIYHKPCCELLAAVPKWFLTERECVDTLWRHNVRPSPCGVCQPARAVGDCGDDAFL